MKSLLFTACLLVSVWGNAQAQTNKNEGVKPGVTEIFTGKINNRLEVVFRWTKYRGEISGSYFYQKNGGADIRLEGEQVNNRLTLWEYNATNQPTARIEGTLDRGRFSGYWQQLSTHKKLPLTFTETDAEIPSIPIDLPGEYVNNEDNRCEFDLTIAKEQDEYSYTLKTYTQLRKGKVTFYRDLQESSLCLTLEGIEWAEYTGPLDEEGEPRMKHPKKQVGVTLLVKDGELMLQNSGNSMNYYVVFAECDAKFVTLSKKTKPNAQVADWMNLANRERTMKNYVQAIRYYQQALAVDSLNSDIYLNLGVTYGDKGDLDSAFVCLNKSIAIDPQNHEAYAYKANAYLATEEYDKGAAAIQQALLLKPNDARYTAMKALMEMDNHQLQESIDDLSKAIELEPTQSNYYYNRSVAYQKQEKTDLALLDLCKAIELNPDYVIALINRASIYREKKAYSFALADLDKAIQLNDKEGKIYLNRGMIRYYMNLKEQAYSDFLKAYYLGTEGADGVILQYCPAKYKKLIEQKK